MLLTGVDFRKAMRSCLVLIFLVRGGIYSSAMGRNKRGLVENPVLGIL
jgi:hypothetical protein